MKLAKNILIIVSYILFMISIVVALVGPEFYYKYKLYLVLLQALFFCTGPMLLFFSSRKKKKAIS